MNREHRRTFKTCVTRILQKLDIPDRVQAVVLANESRTNPNLWYAALVE